MFGYTSFEIGLLTVLIFFCVFTVINRICACIEHCATARSVSKMKIEARGMEKAFNEWKCEDDGK